MTIDKSWTSISNRNSREFLRGLHVFLEHCKTLLDPISGEIACPCDICGNLQTGSINTLWTHISENGFDSTYTIWDKHEENEKMQNCPICNASRWKDLKTKGKKVANKVPLIRELQTLWSGVWTRDDVTCTDFKMKAALLWTINDFPARSSLSGWSGQGYLACPTCNKDTPSAKVRGKIIYVGHRKFLRIRHTMRMKRTFNEYWPTLQLKHNLDVMYIEKNVLESLLGVRLPDGFGSSFKKKVTVDDNNIMGMKSHDSHIMMQRFLPYGAQQYLPKDISPAIIELCLFFKQIYARKLMQRDMEKAKEQLINIMCSLEQIFPPAFLTEFLNNNLEAEFPRWFDLQIRQKGVENDPWCSPESDLFSLACGPESNANSYAACVVNRVKFLVHDRDIHRTTHSSGVATHGPNGEMFHGQLEEILELTYIGNRKVVFFRCKWFDTRNPLFACSDRSKRCYIKQGINHILTDKDSYRDQQYILAIHVRQVFYLEDLARLPPRWKVVEDVHHHKIWHRDVVEDDQDVIHDSKSSDVALSANLGDLDYTSLSTNDESTKVDTSPDNEVPDEESGDFIGDEDDVIPMSLKMMIKITTCMMMMTPLVFMLFLVKMKIGLKL
nr:hypothetical protein [Tanacetum cinerariifolium]